MAVGYYYRQMPPLTILPAEPIVRSVWQRICQLLEALKILAGVSMTIFSFWCIWMLAWAVGG